MNLLRFAAIYVGVQAGILVHLITRRFLDSFHPTAQVFGFLALTVLAALLGEQYALGIEHYRANKQREQIDEEWNA